MKPLRDLVLVVLLSATLDAQHSGSISGTVADITGAVIPGASVTLAGASSEQVRTDQTGVFIFQRLGAGSYKLRIESQAFQARELGVALGEGEARYLGEVRLELAPMWMAMPRDCPPVVDILKVRSRDTRLTGVVLISGHPASGAEVTIYLADAPKPKASTKTNSLGAFQVPKLKPGTYRIVINQESPEPIRVHDITLDKHVEIQLNIRWYPCVFL